MTAKTLKDISHADEFEGQYLVATDTPDGGRSVWPECFGRNALSGRVFFGSDDLAAAVAMLHKHAFIIDRETGKQVGKARISEAAQCEAAS